jgi:pyruvate dehydrogenase E1 component
MQMENFRAKGLARRWPEFLSPPVPDARFWQFPTVSMGLSPIMAIYQARFNRYMEDRGICRRKTAGLGFLGDGELMNPKPWEPSPWLPGRVWTTSFL